METGHPCSAAEWLRRSRGSRAEAGYGNSGHRSSASRRCGRGSRAEAGYGNCEVRIVLFEHGCRGSRAEAGYGNCSHSVPPPSVVRSRQPSRGRLWKRGGPQVPVRDFAQVAAAEQRPAMETMSDGNTEGCFSRTSRQPSRGRLWKRGRDTPHRSERVAAAEQRPAMETARRVYSGVLDPPRSAANRNWSTCTTWSRHIVGSHRVAPWCRAKRAGTSWAIWRIPKTIAELQPPPHAVHVGPRALGAAVPWRACIHRREAGVTASVYLQGARLAGDHPRGEVGGAAPRGRHHGLGERRRYLPLSGIPRSSIRVDPCEDVDSFANGATSGCGVGGRITTFRCRALVRDTYRSLELLGNGSPSRPNQSESR